MINNEIEWENWEWSEDELIKGDIGKKFFLTMEHFGLSIPFSFRTILYFTYI